jgi:hypothetical protein
VVSPNFKRAVIPLTLVILFGLFVVQKHGTAGIGKFFGPITLLDKGVTPIQTAFSPRIEPSMLVREMLLRILNNNNGILRIQQEDTSTRDSEKTAETLGQNIALADAFQEALRRQGKILDNETVKALADVMSNATLQIVQG